MGEGRGCRCQRRRSPLSERLAQGVVVINWQQAAGAARPAFTEISGQLLLHKAEMFNIANTPHHDIPPAANASVNCSTFLQATNILNTGREGIDERSVRFSLRLDF